MDTYHCFGSRWFCLQMDHALADQSRILGDVLGMVRETAEPKQVVPLGYAVQGTAHAMLLLRQGCHLNEAQVLMRLLIERVINVSFLLVCRPGELGENAEQPPQGVSDAPKPMRVSSPEELISATKDFRFEERYDADSMDRKIAVVDERAGIPKDFLRLAIASYYPKASAALTGSATSGPSAIFLAVLKKTREITSKRNLPLCSSRVPCFCTMR